MRKPTRTQEDYERFVVAWQSASSTLDAGRKSGMTASQAITLAAFLRRKGVPLKKFTLYAAPPNYERMRRIAEAESPR